ncbi:hypothetical protein P8452_16536 [Trifolium repens]|nr:hypothetical protein P8452_16536 [Trifolium repens]
MSKEEFLKIHKSVLKVPNLRFASTTQIRNWKQQQFQFRFLPHNNFKGVVDRSTVGKTHANRETRWCAGHRRWSKQKAKAARRRRMKKICSCLCFEF